MNERYAIYWLLPDNSRVYHSDEQSGRKWLFTSYEECWSTGHRLSRPQIEAKLMFEVIQD